MKKRIMLLLCLSLIVAIFVSCNNGTNGEIKKNPFAESDPNNPYDVKTTEILNMDALIVYNHINTNSSITIQLTNSESVNNLFFDYVSSDFIDDSNVLICEYTNSQTKEIRENILKYGKEQVDTSEFCRSFGLRISTKKSDDEYYDLMIRYAEEMLAKPYIKEVSYKIGWGIWFSIPSNDYTADTQWGLEKIQVGDAWGYTTGSSSVKVGVMDSGVAKHNALLENLSDTRAIYGYQGQIRTGAQNNDILESI